MLNLPKPSLLERAHFIWYIFTFPRVFIDFLTKKINPKAEKSKAPPHLNRFLPWTLRRILEKIFYQFFCSPPLWIKVENIFLFRR